MRKIFAASLVACGLFASGLPASAQSIAGCTPGGYRVIARRWDVALNIGWELRQDCAHPDWPARSVAVSAGVVDRSLNNPSVRQQHSPPAFQPLLVRAGDPVTLWLQDDRVRIQMTGVAEQSARSGERVSVQITRQTDDAGLTVQRFTGVVRGPGDVEMER